MKKDAYEKATSQLILQAQDYEIPNSGAFSFGDIVYLLRESFKQVRTYKAVFEMPRDLPKSADWSTDFCLVASYYIYEKTGGDSQWEIMKTVNPAVHWWLRHKVYNLPFDITYTQFDYPFPYERGVPETKIKNPEFLETLKAMSKRLGQMAGME